MNTIIGFVSYCQKPAYKPPKTEMMYSRAWKWAGGEKWECDPYSTDLEQLCQKQSVVQLFHLYFMLSTYIFCIISSIYYTYSP